MHMHKIFIPRFSSIKNSVPQRGNPVLTPNGIMMRVMPFLSIILFWFSLPYNLNDEMSAQMSAQMLEI